MCEKIPQNIQPETIKETDRRKERQKDTDLKTQKKKDGQTVEGQTKRHRQRDKYSRDIHRHRQSDRVRETYSKEHLEKERHGKKHR